VNESINGCSFGLVLASLQSKVRELYDVVCRLESEKYDWEFKLRKVDFEVRKLLCLVMSVRA